MNATDIKIDIVKKLDSLRGNQLDEAYGVLLNFINGKSDVEEWQNLTTKQQESILQGIDQLENEHGISHYDLMKNIRLKYSND
jgi:hypothetical protein